MEHSVWEHVLGEVPAGAIRRTAAMGQVTVGAAVIS